MNGLFAVIAQPHEQVLIVIIPDCLSFLENNSQIKIDSGLIVVDEDSLETDMKDVYAGGDVTKVPGAARWMAPLMRLWKRWTCAIVVFWVVQPHFLVMSSGSLHTSQHKRAGCPLTACTKGIKAWSM